MPTEIKPIAPGVSPYIDTEKRDTPVRRRALKKRDGDYASSIESVIEELSLAGPAEEVDEKQIAAVKQAIIEGKYEVNTEYLAENLIKEYVKRIG